MKPHWNYITGWPFFFFKKALGRTGRLVWLCVTIGAFKTLLKNIHWGPWTQVLPHHPNRIDEQIITFDNEGGERGQGNLFLTFTLTRILFEPQPQNQMGFNTRPPVHRSRLAYWSLLNQPLKCHAYKLKNVLYSLCFFLIVFLRKKFGS